MHTADNADGDPSSGSLAVDPSRDAVDSPGGLPAADDEATTPRGSVSERLTPRGETGRLTPAHSSGMDDDHRNEMAEMSWRLAEAERRAVRSEGEVRQLRDQKKNLEAALLFGTQEEDLRRNVQQSEVQAASLRRDLSDAHAENERLRAAMAQLTGDAGAEGAGEALGQFQLLQAEQARATEAATEAAAMRAERDALQSSVATAQTAMEQMWVSMERLRRDKTAAERTAEAAAAENQRATVADESLQLLLAALVRDGRLEAATTEGSVSLGTSSLADPQRMPQQPNSAWPWTASAAATATGEEDSSSTHPEVLSVRPVKNAAVVPADDSCTPPDVIEDKRPQQEEEKRQENGVEASEASEASKAELAQSPDEGSTGLSIPTRATPPPPLPPPTWPAEHNDMWAHVQAVVMRQEDLQGQLAFARLEISVLEKIISKLRGASGN